MKFPYNVIEMLSADVDPFNKMQCMRTNYRYLG